MSEIDLTAAWSYETALVPSLFAPWAKRAVEVAKPLYGEVVLDLACGTGIGSRLMSSMVGATGKIISVDNDPSMIIVGKHIYSKIIDNDRAEAEWFDSGAESFSLEPNSIDLCTILQGPQFLSDAKLALKNVLFALQPSGRLVATAWARIEENKGHFAIATSLEKLGFQPALKPFSLGENDKLKDLLVSSGFSVENFTTEQRNIQFASVQEFVSGVAAGAPATRHAISQLDENSYEHFFEFVADALSPYSNSKGIELPTMAHIVLATPAA